MNTFGTRVYLPPLDTNLFGICLLCESAGFADWSPEQVRQQRVVDADLDVPSLSLRSLTVQLACHGRHYYTGTVSPPTPRSSSPPPILLSGADADASMSALYTKTSTTPSRSSTRVCPLRYASPHSGRCANPDPVTMSTQVKCVSSGGSQTPPENGIPLVIERRCKSVPGHPWTTTRKASTCRRGAPRRIEDAHWHRNGPGERRHATAERSRECLAAIFEVE